MRLPVSWNRNLDEHTIGDGNYDTIGHFWGKENQSIYFGVYLAKLIIICLIPDL